MILESISIYFVVVATFLFVLVFYLNKNKSQANSKQFPPKLPYGFFDLLRAAFNPNTNFATMFGDLGRAGPLHLIRYTMPELRVLIVNDFELAKDLFSTVEFSSRPENEFWRYHAQGNYGIVTSSGKVWEEQRRYTLRKLKDAGMGNKSMETLMAIEVEDFIAALNSRKGQVMSPNKMTSVPFFNTLWVLLTGERFKQEENTLTGMLHVIYEGFMRIFEIPQVFLLATHKSPISIEGMTRLRSWLPFRTRMDIVEAGFDNLRTFSTQLINNRQENLNRSDLPPSFIDDYLREIEATTNENSTFYKDEGVMNLIATIGDLFIAAGETAANTLSWSMCHLIRNPHVQLKIQAELDHVVGRERLPTLSDKPSLPYCTAFLSEVLRMTPASLFSLPHVCTKDVDVGPYFVEKHTTVLLNIAAIHSEPKIWGDPENFRPERFMSVDGRSFVKHDALIAFSLGKRKCPAERLAMDNLFLFVSAICQKFTLTKDPKLKDMPALRPELSGLNAPKEFFMVVENRV